MRVEASHQVQRQVLLARRETGQHPVAFATTSTFVVIAAKADDARPPHLRLFFGDLLNQLEDLEAVVPFLLVGDAVEELRHTGVVHLGFEIILGHVSLL